MTKKDMERAEYLDKVETWTNRIFWTVVLVVTIVITKCLHVW